METGYFGGMLNRAAAERRRLAGAAAFHGDEDWWCIRDDTELFLRARGPGCQLFSWGTLALLLRGYAVPRDSSAPDLPALAESLRELYLRQGHLPVEQLEGSFPLALLDGQAGRLLIYRNLIGNGFTYYQPVEGGVLFGSNLAALVDAAGELPQPNRAVVPAFFLFRFV